MVDFTWSRVARSIGVSRYTCDSGDRSVFDLRRRSEVTNSDKFLIRTISQRKDSIVTRSLHTTAGVLRFVHTGCVALRCVAAKRQKHGVWPFDFCLRWRRRRRWRCVDRFRSVRGITPVLSPVEYIYTCTATLIVEWMDLTWRRTQWMVSTARRHTSFKCLCLS